MRDNMEPKDVVAKRATHRRARLEAVGMQPFVVVKPALYHCQCSGSCPRALSPFLPRKLLCSAALAIVEPPYGAGALVQQDEQQGVVRKNHSVPLCKSLLPADLGKGRQPLALQRTATPLPFVPQYSVRWRTDPIGPTSVD
jgi:hypothetical protein